MSKRLIKLLPLAAALALSGLATAGTPKDLPSVIVKYGDLNLATKAGVANLHSRLRKAAASRCAARSTAACSACVSSTSFACPTR